MTEPEPRFTVARPEDAAAMRDLARRAYALYVERIGREPAPMGADYAAIAASGTATLVWDGADVVGMMVTSTASGASTSSGGSTRVPE